MPFVYINNPDKAPLKDDLKLKLSKSVFYFDLDEEDYKEKIKLFLNKPYNEIFKVWKSKKIEREKFIQEYICVSSKGSGKKAYNILTNLIK